MSLIRYLTRIHFADRAMEDALPEELRARGLSAPLILADADAGMALPRLLDCLPSRARPTVLQIGAGSGPEVAGALGPGNHDLVIGLGSATAIDLARTARPSRPAEAPLPPEVGRGRAAEPPMPRMVVPTLPGCLGLGPVALPVALPGAARGPGPGPIAEGRATVPCVVFCDPWLLRHAPPDRLAIAGMDALVHCLEALLSTAWNPPADGMAFDGLRRAGLWLERLCQDPQDPAARREVMAAALNGALAAQKGLGAIHALAFAAERLMLGAGRHGSLHAALLSPVLAFNAPAVPDRIAQAAEALRLPAPSALAGHLTALGRRLGLPVTLEHLGLTPPGIARLADAAAEDPANSGNPRLAGAEDYRAMIAAALLPAR